jgi:hypothetical protein
MSAMHEVRKWTERGVPGCHSGGKLGPADAVEGVSPVVGGYLCVGWVGGGWVALIDESPRDMR